MATFKAIVILSAFLSLNFCQRIRPQHRSNLQHFELDRVKTSLNASNFVAFPRLSALEIGRCAIHEIHDETFKGVPLLILSVHDNIEFPTISSEFFTYLRHTLKVFRFDFNPYSFIEDGAFSDLKKLEVLSVTHQNIKRLTASFLEGLENLKEISLKHNNIEIIEKNALKNLVNLNSIYLSHNALKAIESGTFSAQTNLVDLQLNSNKFSVIDWDKFDRIVSLKYLNLGDNQFVYIPVQKVLTAFPVLESVNFMPNNFTCSSELYITRQFRHYRISIEYYGPVHSRCTDFDVEKTVVEVFSDLD